MDRQLVWIIAAVCFDGAAAFLGGILPSPMIRRNRLAFIALASGVMLTVALIEMIPEAIGPAGKLDLQLSLVIAGFTAFFLLESLFGRHEHRSLGPSLLLGDALHNISDGMALAAAFLTSTQLGVTTSLAVFIHELPQETGDYVVLIDQGYRRRKALFWLFLVQLTAAIGALAVYWSFHAIQNYLPALVSFAAGGFIYIAAVDLLPILNSDAATGREKLKGRVFFLIGIGIIALLKSLFVE